MAVANAWYAVGVGDAFDYNKNFPINGLDVVCTNATYNISGLPTGTSVSWSATPSGIVSLSPNGNQVTVSKVDNGTVTLSANINSSCGSFTVSKNIAAGIPEHPTAVDDNGNLIYTITSCTNIHNSVCLRTQSPGVDDWKWEKVTGNFNLVDLGRCAQVIGFQPGSGFISGSTHNACGWSQPALVVVQITDCSMSATNQDSVKLFPNPASNSITLVVGKQNVRSKVKVEKKSAEESINAVKIFDSYGRVRFFQKYDQQQMVSIDVGNLENGIFIVEVNTGNSKEYQKLIIQK